MSSRFFKAVSDSESESSEGETEPVSQRPGGAGLGANAYDFSDDEEETKRQVKSAKDKHSEQLHELIRSIKNKKKVKDFTKILPDFEELTRKYSKVKTILDKESDGKTPRFLIKCLVELEDFVEQCWEDRERRKSMNKNNSKCLSSLRQKLRKYNKTLQEEIEDYRKSPDAEDGAQSADEKEGASDSDDNDKDSDDESIDSVNFVKRPVSGTAAAAASATATDATDSKTKAKSAPAEDSGDESDTDWGSSDDDSSLSSDDDKYEGNLAARFLKRQDEREDKEAATAKRVKKAKPEKSRADKKKADDEDDRGWQSVQGTVTTSEKPKMFAKESEINHQNVLKKLVEVLAMRGKKRADKSDQTEMMLELLNITRQYKLGPAIEIRIILGLISSLLEYNPSVLDHIKIGVWEELLKYLNVLIDVLQANPDLIVNESVDEEEENYESSPYKLNGSPVALAERMDAEFLKLLQSSDAHTPEYVERLKYEKAVCKIIDRLQEYYESDMKRTQPSELCRVYLLKIDHLYYKFDSRVIKQMQQKERAKRDGENQDPAGEKTGADEEPIVGTSADVINQLCKYIYANDTTQRPTTQAILSHIYFLSLHDSYFEARDLMLMSHLQGNISKADIPLQVMYNRALVQLGLCAFRKGFIADAHAALLDIQILGKARELLAQGLPLRHQERTAEQERLERRRQIPFHKHINLDLLECVYLVSSMLLEIPDVAANEFSVRKKMISRLFYNQLRKSEEQPLVGLPETTREHVVAASKAMRVGKWKACRDLIINDKVNLKVWNLFHQADSVRSMLETKIREGSLRAYLFTYSNVYDSISMQVLANMFDLNKSTVHSIVSKMIINEELMASLDEPTQSIVMHRTEPSRLQGLALQMAEKINYLVDQNVRVSEHKQYGTERPGGRGNMRQQNPRNNRNNQNSNNHHHNNNN
uniref:Eukaryotic translation initiation factor 3 subunit C n=1 Tax=Aceria tosichella TaxID=561515 RepID=A0A6G1S4P5_9ACAR